ncbi:integral membrane protein [Phlyctema vagabunda]|uniref:Integral membrane protein n=1 Tax=Phlyctema vagabunda TaxID=108571 RepID=A0ABR4PK41_9HELO
MGEDRGRILAAVLSLFLGLTWLFVSLRMYVKLFLTKSRGKDDYFLMISLLFFTIYAACSLTGVKHGTGRQPMDIPVADVPTALFYWFLCEIFYTVTTINVRTKVSIAGVLALGLLAGVATLIRIPYIRVLTITDEFLYATTDVAIWSTIEPGLGIVAFSIAPLRPLFRTFYNLTAQPPNNENNKHTTTFVPVTSSEYSRHLPQHKDSNETSSNAATAANNSIRLRDDIFDNGAVTISSMGGSNDPEIWVDQDRIQVHRTLDVESRRGSGSEVECKTQS